MAVLQTLALIAALYLILLLFAIAAVTAGALYVLRAKGLSKVSYYLPLALHLGQRAAARTETVTEKACRAAAQPVILTATATAAVRTFVTTLFRGGRPGRATGE